MGCGGHSMKFIKLSTKGYETIVDNDLFDELNKHKWHLARWRDQLRVQRTAWIKKTKKRKTIRMSRRIMEFPKGMVVDHINHNLLDNRRCNLRVCTIQQNNLNRKIQSNNKCGFKGVCFIPGKKNKKNPWLAQIAFNGKHIYLGYSPTPEKAHEAYCVAALKYHGKFANFGEEKEVQFAQS